MTLTPKMIERMRRYWPIDEQLEKILLIQLGTEPHPHVYSEQDLHEQSRKLIMQYNANITKTRNVHSESGAARNIDYTKRPGGDIP